MVQNEKVSTDSVEIICGTCGLPVGGATARTDVTRYLAETSRCQCNRERHAAPDESRGDSEFSPARRGATHGIKLQICLSVEDAAEVLGERYEVLSFLGQGGMGSVFRVVDKTLGTTLAVKILNPNLVQNEDAVKRFEREAKASMQLSDPHLAAVYAYGMGLNQTPYLVMDYLEGKTLDRVLKESGSVDHHRALDLFIQICEGLAQAHSKGVVHRDIKPNNIMIIHPTADVEFAKVFDFGIAKVLPDQALDLTSDMTRAGELFGSPLYMAPEQCQDNPVDQRSDIHALGCVMYKTLTGVHPFEGKNILDTVAKIITAPAASMMDANHRNHIPKDLDAIVLKCLRKSPEDRYFGANELRSDLVKVRDGRPLEWSAEDTPKPPVNSALRPALNYGIVTATLLFGFCALGLYLFATSFSNSVSPSSPPIGLPADPYKDAERLDQLSFTYYNNGDYERAIPLLEFGIKTYKANGNKKVAGGTGREDVYLAENISHVGKCYLMLKKYPEAQNSFREALKIFQRWGFYPGGSMTEAVNDYASTLRGLGQSATADAMLKDFQANKNLTSIP